MMPFIETDGRLILSSVIRVSIFTGLQIHFIELAHIIYVIWIVVLE